MKYLVAFAALFVVAANAPAANAEVTRCGGGIYNSACIAGAYDYVVVRRPVGRRCAWVRGVRVC
jgi:hypothetical protein